MQGIANRPLRICVTAFAIAAMTGCASNAPKVFDNYAETSKKIDAIYLFNDVLLQDDVKGEHDRVMKCVRCSPRRVITSNTDRWTPLARSPAATRSMPFFEESRIPVRGGIHRNTPNLNGHPFTSMMPVGRSSVRIR